MLSSKPAQSNNIFPPQLKAMAPCYFLVLAVIIFYSNVYDNAFLFDDPLIITSNEYLRSWHTLGQLLTGSTTAGVHVAGGFYRPLQMLLYFLVYQMAGLSVFAFHLLNIGLHAANACLVYALGRKLKFNWWAVFLAALIWALHPIHTEAVTYMSATADTLYSFFCLSGVIILLPDFTPRKFLISIPIFILGLLSKETAVMFPLLVMSCMFLTCDDRRKPKIYLRTWPLWAVTGIYLVWRLNAPDFSGPQTDGIFYQQHDYYNFRLYAEHAPLRIYTFFATLPTYLGIMAWPVHLHMERDFKIFADFWIPQVLIGLAVCVAALGQMIWGRGRRGLPLSWGIMWFAVAHAPNTGLLIPVNALLLEHWMYLPTAGFFLGVGQTLSAFLEKASVQKLKPFAAGISLAIALALGMATYIQNMVWHDPVIFYSHLIKYGITSARVHNNLAMAYTDRNNYELGIVEYKKAIAITDTYAETWHNLALAYLNLPDPDKHVPEAIGALNRAIEIDPRFYRSYMALADIYAHTGDSEKEAYYRRKGEEIQKEWNP